MNSVIRFLADEDFDHDIVRGVLRRNLSIDILTVQEAGLKGKKDPDILEWAAQNGRILLTRDVNTMVAEAYLRVQKGLPLPGVFAVSQLFPIAQCSFAEEWIGQVRFLPLR